MVVVDLAGWLVEPCSGDPGWHVLRVLSLWVELAVKTLIKSYDSYLVDPASSHMLVSKIKPCMSKYKHVCTVKLQMAHYISYSLFDG